MKDKQGQDQDQEGKVRKERFTGDEEEADAILELLKQDAKDPKQPEGSKD